MKPTNHNERRRQTMGKANNEAKVSNPPKCERCGASGAGVQFNIFGPFPFGKYCVPCEATSNNPTPQK